MRRELFAVANTNGQNEKRKEEPVCECVLPRSIVQSFVRDRLKSQTTKRCDMESISNTKTLSINIQYWKLTPAGPRIPPFQSDKKVSPESTKPKLMDMSPWPFSLFSSSSKSLKFRGTMTVSPTAVLEDMLRKAFWFGSNWSNESSNSPSSIVSERAAWRWKILGLSGAGTIQHRTTRGFSVKFGHNRILNEKIPKIKI